MAKDPWFGFIFTAEINVVIMTPVDSKIARESPVTKYNKFPLCTAKEYSQWGVVNVRWNMPGRECQSVAVWLLSRVLTDKRRKYKEVQVESAGRCPLCFARVWLRLNWIAADIECSANHNRGCLT